MLLCIGLVIFRSSSLATAGLMLARMVHPLTGATLPTAALVAGLFIIGLIFAGHMIGQTKMSRRLETLLPAPALGAGMAIFFLLIQLLIPEQGRPFIYFQF